MRKTFLVGLVCLAGCASVSVAPDKLKQIAASDLSCLFSKISVRQISDSNWTAAGCGKKQSYVCSGSNFMTSGFCVKN